jgi:cytosine permease
MSEDYALEPVPEASTISGFRIALVSIGIIVALPAFISGAEIGFALGFQRGSLAVILGGIFLGLMAMATGTVAATTRLNTAMIIKLTFGSIGGKVVSFLLSLTLLGWFGVTAELFGHGVFQVLSQLGWNRLPEAVYVATGGILMVITTVFGFSALQRLSNVTVPMLAILITFTAWLTLHRAGAGALSGGGATNSSLGDGISAIVGGLSVAVTIFPDFCRFSRTTRDARVAAALTYGAAMPAILLLAMIPSVVTHQRDLISIMTTLGLGVPALALLIVKAWATNAGNLYSASLSAANSLSSKNEKWIIIVGGSIGTMLAVGGISDSFIPFLIALSVGIPPIAGIYVADLLGAAERVSSDVTPASVRYGAFACWGLGVAAALAARAGLLTITGISAADSMLVAAASYVMFYRIGPWLNALRLSNPSV